MVSGKGVENPRQNHRCSVHYFHFPVSTLLLLLLWNSVQYKTATSSFVSTVTYKHLYNSSIFPSTFIWSTRTRWPTLHRLHVPAQRSARRGIDALWSLLLRILLRRLVPSFGTPWVHQINNDGAVITRCLCVRMVWGGVGEGRVRVP